jgi:hypothetical protein
MKIDNIIEHKNGSVTIKLEMNKKERDFIMELGVNEIIKSRLKIFENNLKEVDTCRNHQEWVESLTKKTFHSKILNPIYDFFKRLTGKYYNGKDKDK